MWKCFAWIGWLFLKKIVNQQPIPVAICSSATENRSETTLKAIEYGAVETIHKPQVGSKQFLQESNIMICNAVKTGARYYVEVKRGP